MATAVREEAPEHATLAIDAMTCASWATRIERRLNRLDGVSATVTFASEQAEVNFDAGRVSLPAGVCAEATRLAAAGATVVAVAWDGRARRLIAAADTVKPGAAAAVCAQRGLGLDPALLTGDNQAAAQAVAERVGITRVLAGVLPEDKAAEVAKLQARGEVVAMVGDSINDAPAIAQADLGLAIGTGSDIAIETAAIALVCGHPLAAADAILLARRFTPRGASLA